MSITNDPFFIVGVHRSGTTLLRYMLSSSPRIYVPPESDFIPRFFLNKPHQRVDEAATHKMLKIIFDQYRFVREWVEAVPETTTFYNTMSEKTPSGFLDALYGRYARQQNAVRWGDKTPIYSSYIDLLHEIFPQAKFIHIIRDGRDVALSMLEKWEEKELHIDIYFSARNWLRRIQDAQRSGQKLGARSYLEIRYEALVAEPEATVQAVCAFLNEPYVPEMIEQHQLARQSVAAGSFHAPVRQPPTTKRIGRWRLEMAPTDLRLFERVAGEMLLNLGYPLAATTVPSANENARFYALSLKYHTLQAGRLGLQTLGIKPPI